MKALVISALLFFSLRAMSATVGEDKKGECIYSSQTAKREKKEVKSEGQVQAPKEDKKEVIAK
jgi:hypothetical protein